MKVGVMDGSVAQRQEAARLRNGMLQVGFESLQDPIKRRVGAAVKRMTRCAMSSSSGSQSDSEHGGLA